MKITELHLSLVTNTAGSRLRAGFALLSDSIAHSVTICVVYGKTEK